MSRIVIRAVACTLVTILAACRVDSDENAAGENAAHEHAAPAPSADAPRAAPLVENTSASGLSDMMALHTAFVQHVDSIDRKLRRVRALTRDERARLRRDVNEQQIQRARQLGVRVGTSVDPLVRNGRLVRLPDTTDYWLIRELDYSVPYVTPDAHALLVEIGERFHAQLDSLGVPRYRMDITSILRTPEKQAALRRANSNASKVESAHEFGTTVDIAYRRFAPPPGPLPQTVHPTVAAQARLLCDSLVIETGRLRGAELQAVLGRVLHAMQQEGKVMVRMERRQTVYHITVARRLPRRDTRVRS